MNLFIYYTQHDKMNDVTNYLRKTTKNIPKSKQLLCVMLNPISTSKLKTIKSIFNHLVMQKYPTIVYLAKCKP